MSKSGIKKDYFWNTVGVFAQNAVSPLLLIVVTRINGVYDSGLFSFALSISLILLSLGLWGGRTYQVSDVRHEFMQRSYVMARVLLAFAMMIGAIAFSIVNHYELSKTALIIALAALKVVESLADVVYGIMQINGRLYVSGKSLLYKAIGGLAAFALLDFLTKDILLSCAALVLVNLSIFLFYDLRVVRTFESIGLRNQLCRTLSEAIRILQRCLPIFAVTFLGMFSLNIPRYFIDLYHQEQIGYFGIIAMPITLIILLMSFILQPNVVGLSKQYIEGNLLVFNKTVVKILTVTLIVGLLTLIAVYLIGVEVLHLVFGVDFSNYKTALLIIVTGGVINSIVAIFMTILTIMRTFKIQFYVLLLTNLALLAVSPAIIQSGGLVAGVSLFTGVNLLQLTLLMMLYGSKVLRSRHG